MAPPALTATIPPTTDVRPSSTITHTLAVAFSDPERGHNPAAQTLFEQGISTALLSVYSNSSKPAWNGSKPLYGSRGVCGYSTRLICNEAQSQQLLAAVSSTGRLACSAAGISFHVSLQLPEKRHMHLRLSSLPTGVVDLGKGVIAETLGTAGLAVSSVQRAWDMGLPRSDALDVSITAAEPIPTKGSIKLVWGERTHRIQYAERIAMLPPAAKLPRGQQQQRGRGRATATAAASHEAPRAGGMHAAPAPAPPPPPAAQSLTHQQQASGTGETPMQQQGQGENKAPQAPATAAEASGSGANSSEALATAQDAAAGASTSGALSELVGRMANTGCGEGVTERNAATGTPSSSMDGGDGPAWGLVPTNRERRQNRQERRRVAAEHRANLAVSAVLTPLLGGKRHHPTTGGAA